MTDKSGEETTNTRTKKKEAGERNTAEMEDALHTLTKSNVTSRSYGNEFAVEPGLLAVG